MMMSHLVFTATQSIYSELFDRVDGKIFSVTFLFNYFLDAYILSILSPHYPCKIGKGQSLTKLYVLEAASLVIVQHSSCYIVVGKFA